MIRPEDRRKIEAWSAIALCHTGPYPVLVLKGNATKSYILLGRILRALDGTTPIIERCTGQSVKSHIFAGHNPGIEQQADAIGHDTPAEGGRAPEWAPRPMPRSQAASGRAGV